LADARVNLQQVDAHAYVYVTNDLSSFDGCFDLVLGIGSEVASHEIEKRWPVDEAVQMRVSPPYG